MRLSFCLRVGMLAGLAVVTSMVTSLVISRVRGAQGAQLPTQARIREVGKVKIVRAGAIVPRAVSPHSIAGGTMQRYQVRMEGTNLHISAQAYIRDKRPNALYAWNVKIMNNQADRQNPNDIIFERIYDNQTFTLPEGEANPSFDDVFNFNVSKGRYVIETSIYRVDPQLGLQGLRDPKVAKVLRGPVGRATVLAGN